MRRRWILTQLSLKCQCFCLPAASINAEMSTRAGEEQQCHTGGGHLSTHLLEDPAE